MNIDRPDLNLLVVLDAVLKAGSVTGAAVQINLSQPAISHALNRLRKITGDPLFVRSGQRLVPTPHAMALQVQVGDILSAARHVLSKTDFDPGRDERTFRIACTDYTSLTIIPRLLGELRRASPGISLELTPANASTLEALENGAVSLSFWGAEPPGKPYEMLDLYHEHFVGIVWKSHPLAHKGAVTLEDYLAYPHVSVRYGTGTDNPIEIALMSIGRTREIRFTAHSVSANFAAMRDTDLVMALPSRIAGYAGTLGFVQFALPFRIEPFPYGIIWHRRTDSDPAHQWLRARIQASVRGNPSTG